MKNICVIGVGYVGLVTSTCFADLGNHVIALGHQRRAHREPEAGAAADLRAGPGGDGASATWPPGGWSFTTSYAEALRGAEFAFIAVGTPEGVDGEADLQYVRQAAESIAKHMRGPLIIVNKSTVPVGTGDWVAEIVHAASSRSRCRFQRGVAAPSSCAKARPLADFMNPDRMVLGSLDREAADRVAELHLPLRAPIMVTDLRTAEMIKYASNAFLATKISFINEIANICEALGADVKEVAAGMGYDQRIGRQFLDAGLGYGGSCFPKDVKALAHMANVQGRHPQLLQAVMDINRDQRRQVVDKVRELVGEPERQARRPAGAGLQAQHRRHARRAGD